MCGWSGEVDRCVAWAWQPGLEMEAFQWGPPGMVVVVVRGLLLVRFVKTQKRPNALDGTSMLNKGSFPPEPVNGRWRPPQLRCFLTTHCRPSLRHRVLSCAGLYRAGRWL